MPPFLTNTKYTLVYSHPRTSQKKPHKSLCECTCVFKGPHGSVHPHENNISYTSSISGPKIFFFFSYAICVLYNAWPVIITALLHALLCLSTYSSTHTHTLTHPASCVSSHILYSSTLTLSPTLSVCSLSNSYPDE